MPPDPPRVTHREMAEALGCSPRTVETIISWENGADIVSAKLKRAGICVFYEVNNNRIYFYREEEH